MIRRTLPALTALAIVAFAAGCGGNGAAPPATAAAPSAAQPTAIESLSLRANETGDGAAQIDAFVETAHDAELERALRAFGPYSEEEYAALPADERERLGNVYLKVSEGLRAIARAATDRARELAAAGRRAEAERIVEAVERVADANATEDTVLLGQMSAEALHESAEQAREDVEADDE